MNSIDRPGTNRVEVQTVSVDDSRQSRQEPATETPHLPLLWGSRGFWQIRLRWIAAPLILAGVVAGRLVVAAHL